MVNILMINLPYEGHTNPTLSLARRLITLGYRVSYINAEEFREKIQETGAKFIPYINYPDNPSEHEKKTKSFRAAFDTAINIDEKYDLVIYEMFFYPGIEVAKRLGCPCVRQFSQPAWNEKIVKSANFLWRASCNIIDMQVMGKKNVEYMGLQHRSLKEAVLYDKPDLNIVYVPKIFQPYKDSFPKNYLFTIPSYKTLPSKHNIPYDKMQYPIVYISLGSIISNKGFCKECIKAFGGKKVSVILNTGKVNPKVLGKIPENIYAYSFVPQIEVLQHAKVFLTHCGMNSVNEAMTYGVPMVAMPFINDQIDNAKRILELGIGKKVRSFPSRGKELYNTVISVLEDEKIRKRSSEIRELLKDEMSMDYVIIEIEKLI